jgi:ubiquitin-like modifier-activating enzyme ATG7
MPVVQFAPFASLVQPGFWHELTRMKIDVLRLSEDAITVNGSYTVGRSIRDRETGQDIALGCNLTVGEDAYQKAPQYVQYVAIGHALKLICRLCPRLPPMSVQATGIFKNFNTIEDFKAADKAALVNGVVSKVRS